MKPFFYVLIISIFTLFYNDNCKVKIPELNKKYKGECKKKLAHGYGVASGEKDSYEGEFKKGLPHGNGTYKWGNGNIYKGSWLKGLMDGEGELLIIEKSGAENIKKGFFKKGEYLGKYKQPYKVILESGIRKIDFQESAISQNEVKITVHSNGRKINPNILITDTNNTTIENRNGKVLTNVIFPLKRVLVSFKVDSFSYKAIFDIYKKGNWEVVISL